MEITNVKEQVRWSTGQVRIHEGSPSNYQGMASTTMNTRYTERVDVFKNRESMYGQELNTWWQVTLNFTSGKTWSGQFDSEAEAKNFYAIVTASMKVKP